MRGRRRHFMKYERLKAERLAREKKLVVERKS
jgi:hypothetical protein